MTEYIAPFAAGLIGAYIGASAARGSTNPDLARVNFKLRRIAEHLGIDMKPNLPGSIIDLARSGKRINAIKELRNLQPGLGLKEAKDQVDLIDP